MVAMKEHGLPNKKWIPIAAIALFLVACSTADFVSETSTATPIPQEKQTIPTQQMQSENSDLLLSDDFSDMNSGWEAEDSNTSRYYYSDGEYIIEANNNPSYFFIVNNDSYNDGVFSISMRHLSGDPDETGGMVFWRYQDNNDFYAMTVTADGEFSIHRFLHGKYDLISLPIKTPLLKTGDQSNKITIVFHGITSEIFINDQFAYSFNDPSLPNGKIGMGASPARSSAVKVAFDDLSVYKYDPGSPFTPEMPEPTPAPNYQPINWSQLVQFLADDHTNWHEYDLDTYNCVDYAVDLAAAAERQNIKVRLVGVDFVGQDTGHAFVEFDTTDRGPIFVEPQGDNTYSNVKIGNDLCDDWGKYECMGVISDIQYFGACDHQHNCTVSLPQ